MRWADELSRESPPQKKQGNQKKIQTNYGHPSVNSKSCLCQRKCVSKNMDSRLELSPLDRCNRQFLTRISTPSPPRSSLLSLCVPVISSTAMKGESTIFPSSELRRANSSPHEATAGNGRQTSPTWLRDALHDHW